MKKLFGKKFRILAVLLVWISCCFLSGCSTLIYHSYSSNAQVVEIAENLGFDLNDTLWKDDLARFAHNNGKPIQIVIADELKEYEPLIKSGLDEIIGLIHSVNDKYSYKIVDKAKKNVSTISFKSGTPKTTDALAYLSGSFNVRQLLTTTINEAAIVLCLDNYAQEVTSIQEYVIKHELIRVFNLMDVPQKSGINNTIMSPAFGSKISKLTPYDFSSILALYTPPAKNKKDLKEKINSCKEYLAEYETEYYDYYTQKQKELISAQNNQVIFDSFDTDKNFVFNAAYSPNGPFFYSCYYEITFNNNNYTLNISDVNGKLLDSATGEAVIQNDMVILKNVKLEHGLRPDSYFALTIDEYIQDLVLYKANGNVYMYDCYEKSSLLGSIEF